METNTILLIAILCISVPFILYVFGRLFFNILVTKKVKALEEEKDKEEKELEVSKKELEEKPVVKTVSKKSNKKVKKPVDEKTEPVKPEIDPKADVLTLDGKVFTPDEFDNKKFYMEAKARDFYGQYGRFKRWRLKKAMRTRPDMFVLIRMRLINEAVLEFIVKYNDDGFRWKKRRYIFDDATKYFNASIGLWCYDFEETLCVPIKTTNPFHPDLQAIVEKLNEYQELYKKGQEKSVPSAFKMDEIKQVLATGKVTEVEKRNKPDQLRTVPHK